MSCLDQVAQAVRMATKERVKKRNRQARILRNALGDEAAQAYLEAWHLRQRTGADRMNSVRVEHDCKSKKKMAAHISAQRREFIKRS